MKLYNPSTTDVPDIFNIDKSKPLIAGGENITIDDEKGSKLLERYGFLINWTKLPNCPTFRSDSFEEIKKIEGDLIKEQERRFTEEEKKKVFNPKGEDKLKVFISFTDDGEDLKIATEMNSRVRDLDYEVFFFKHSQLPSEKIAGIMRKLKAADIVIAILSEKAKESHFVVQEIGIAESEGIPIFPIAIERLRSYDIGFFRDTNAERYFEHKSIERVMDKFNKAVYKHFAETKDLEIIQRKSNVISSLLSKWVSTRTLLHRFEDKYTKAEMDSIKYQLRSNRNQLIQIQSDIKSIFGDTSDYVLSIERLIHHINSALQVHFTIDGGASLQKWHEELKSIQDELIKLKNLIEKTEKVNLSNLSDEKRKIKDMVVGWLKGISPDGELSEFVNNCEYNSTLLLNIYYYSTFGNNPLEDYQKLAEELMDLCEPRTNTDYMKIQNNLGYLIEKANSLA